MASDIGDTVRNRDIGQSFAPVERAIINAGDAVADCDTGQVCASKECIASDADDAVRNCAAFAFGC